MRGCRSRRRFLKQTLFLILAVVFCFGWSYTTTSISSLSSPRHRLSTHNDKKISISPQRQTQEGHRRQKRTALLFFSQEEEIRKSCMENNVISDSELIKSLIAAKTTKDVDRTLRGALNIKVSGKEPHSNDDSSLPPSTRQQREGLMDGRTTIPFASSGLSFNVTAAAMRRLAHVAVIESRQNNSSKKASQKLQKELLIPLMETIGNQIVSAKQEQQRQPSSSTSLGVYALADVLQALAILSHSNGSGGGGQHMQPLATLVLELMAKQEPHELHKLGPIRMVQCLQACAKLQLSNEHLQNSLFQRLLKPDAVSKIPARYLSHGLRALTYWSDSKSNDHQHRDSTLLTRAFMRRLRKQKVRDEATISDLCQALVATNQILKQGGMDDFEDEAAIFGFTTLRAILDKRRESSQQSSLKPTELSEMISSWATLSNSKREDTVIEELLQICQEEKTLERCTVRQLESIIGSVERLHVTNHAETMRHGGERLVKLVLEEKHKPLGQAKAIACNNPFHPNAIGNILRCPVLLHRRDSVVMKPYLEASSMLLVDDDFLRRCNVGQLANFLWFMSVAHWRHNDVLQSIGERILDPSLVESCSPKLACRILGTYTSILCVKESSEMNQSSSEIRDDDTIHSLTEKLFHEYGGYLLTSKLSPAEASSALVAYAKASYVRDMGIYDHLVSLIASMTNQCSVRQLAQSIWSCGKMIAWEHSADYSWGDEGDVGMEPPYLKSAKSIAIELSQRTDELSSVDVTQCIWALGKLRISEEKVLEPIMHRAKDLAPTMNSVELSNVLWGLGKFGFQHDKEMIRSLITRLVVETSQVSPKEAASTLYTLGRLNFRDEEAFEKLSRVLIEHIEDVSAQAIANTLWAYRAVELTPPTDLLNLWATQKLGLVGIQTMQTLNED